MSDEQSWGTGDGWGNAPQPPPAWDQAPQSPPGWGQAPQSPPGWGQQPPAWGDQGVGQPPPPGQQPPFGQPPPFGQQPPFGQPSPFGQQPPFGQPSSSTGNRTLIIVLSVIGGIVLLFAIGIVALFNFVGDRVDNAVEQLGGEFEFDTTDTAPVPGGPRLLEEDGSIETAGGRASYEFAITGRSTVQIDVIGRDGFDPLLTLLDHDGNFIAEDDDGGALLDSQLITELGEGTYTVQVEGYSTNTGAFEVIVTTP